MNWFRQRGETAPNVATLHFAGWGYDDREDANVYREEGANVLVVETGRQAFILREMCNYVFFRRRGDPDERASWFLLEDYKHGFLNGGWRGDIKKFPPQRFVEGYAKQAYGRCLLYVADFMKEHQCAFLCFAPDGTGFAIDYTEERLVDFRWQDITPMKWPELRDGDPEHLRPLCRTVFDTLVHPRLTNPYIDPDSLKDIPHEFISGSEQELRHLTTIIAQTEPGLFDETMKPVTVVYRAQTPTKRAYMVRIARGGENDYAKSVTERLGRLQSLCDLALRLNTFTGVKWETWEENPNRLGHFMKTVRQARIEVQPPSAHERAEALLSLSDWLQGKAREEKRLLLLGVEDDS